MVRIIVEPRIVVRVTSGGVWVGIRIIINDSRVIFEERYKADSKNARNVIELAEKYASVVKRGKRVVYYITGLNLIGFISSCKCRIPDIVWDWIARVLVLRVFFKAYPHCIEARCDWEDVFMMLDPGGLEASLIIPRSIMVKYFKIIEEILNPQG